MINSEILLCRRRKYMKIIHSDENIQVGVKVKLCTQFQTVWNFTAISTDVLHHLGDSLLNY